MFDTDRNEVLGAYTMNYLLEKSRVTKQSSEERNYHMFYHLLKGASDEMLGDLRLLLKDGSRASYKDYNYLKTGTDIQDKEILDDVELFHEVDKVFKDLGFSPMEVSAIYKTIATVLLIGQLEFDDSKFDESGVPCTVSNRDRLQDIAYLMGIEDVTLFEEEIVNKPKGPHETVRAPMKLEDCNDARDSLAKAIYNNLFCWIVKRTNLTILPEFMIKGEQAENHIKTIGLLDIFGFERFKENFFE